MYLIYIIETALYQTVSILHIYNVSYYIFAHFLAHSIPLDATFTVMVATSIFITHLLCLYFFIWTLYYIQTIALSWTLLTYLIALHFKNHLYCIYMYTYIQ